jgi:hypothetical protein
MIVWGGSGNGGPLNTGGRYDPGTDSWTPTSTTNAPVPRTYLYGQALGAVWDDLDNLMIVWGGSAGGSGFNTGGRYNPSTDSWTATSLTNAPQGQDQHATVWLGPNDRLGWNRWPDQFEHRQEVRSGTEQLDSHQHHERAIYDTFTQQCGRTAK